MYVDMVFTSSSINRPSLVLDSRAKVLHNELHGSALREIISTFLVKGISVPFTTYKLF